MKLLHVICTTDLESGGPIEAVQRITEVLIQDGHDIQVVSLESPEVVSKRSFHFPLIGIGKGIGRYHYNPSLTPWMRAKVKNFDVVVMHGIWNYSSLGAWRGIQGLGVPYFVFAHGMMDPWFRDAFPVKHVAKQLYWTFAEGRVLEGARRVLFTCEEERLRARGVYRGHSYREQVVPYGTLDPKGDAMAQRAAFEQAFPALKGRRFLLFISRIHEKKGCDLLIDAFADCLAGMPADMDLVMAGPDQVGWMKDLKAQAERRGASHRIHWTGMVKGDLKWGALRSAVAMILPSHQENFGFVVPEAMACSTPVLISDKVNIWREVLEAKAGLVEPDTLEGTRKLIRGFLALGAAESEAMRTAAREGFKKNFDIEFTAREFARILDELRLES